MKTKEEKKQYARDYYLKNKAKFTERNARRDKVERNRKIRERYATDPEYRSRCLSYRKHPDKARNQQLKRDYGITLEEYNERLEFQGGVCAICKCPPTGRFQLAVDHCHSTGMIRGLLCSFCNHGIGNFRDDVERWLRQSVTWTKLQRQKPDFKLATAIYHQGKSRFNSSCIGTTQEFLGTDLRMKPSTHFPDAVLNSSRSNSPFWTLIQIAINRPSHLNCSSHKCDFQETRNKFETRS